jgi:hypothetical protein
VAPKSASLKVFFVNSSNRFFKTGIVIAHQSGFPDRRARLNARSINSAAEGASCIAFGRYHYRSIKYTQGKRMVLRDFNRFPAVPIASFFAAPLHPLQATAAGALTTLG